MVLFARFLGPGTAPEGLAKSIDSCDGFSQAPALDTKALASKAPTKIPDPRIGVRVAITLDDLIKVII